MVFICHPATKMPGCALGLRRSWTGLSSFDVMLFALPTFFPLPILIPGYSFVLIPLKIFFKFLTSYLNFGRNYHLYSPLPILTAVCISSIYSIIILSVFPLHPSSDTWLPRISSHLWVAFPVSWSCPWIHKALSPTSAHVSVLLVASVLSGPCSRNRRQVQYHEVFPFIFFS